MGVPSERWVVRSRVCFTKQLWAGVGTPCWPSRQLGPRKRTRVRATVATAEVDPRAHGCLLASVLHALAAVWPPRQGHCCAIAGLRAGRALSTPSTRLRACDRWRAAPHELGIGTNKWKLKHIDAVQATFGAALVLVSLFDTAQCYASSEPVWVTCASGDERFIVTKFDSLRGARPPHSYIRKSLFDLDLECVDAYLVHFPRGDIDELAAGLAEAVELGLTKRVGCSNFGRTEMLALRRALQKRGVPLSIVEVEFSLLRRRTEGW